MHTMGSHRHLSKMSERINVGFGFVFFDLRGGSRRWDFALNLILSGSRSNFKTGYLNII